MSKRARSTKAPPPSPPSPIRDQSPERPIDFIDISPARAADNARIVREFCQPEDPDSPQSQCREHLRNPPPDNEDGASLMADIASQYEEEQLLDVDGDEATSMTDDIAIVSSAPIKSSPVDDDAAPSSSSSLSLKVASVEKSNADNEDENGNYRYQSESGKKAQRAWMLDMFNDMYSHRKAKEDSAAAELAAIAAASAPVVIASSSSSSSSSSEYDADAPLAPGEDELDRIEDPDEFVIVDHSKSPILAVLTREEARVLYLAGVEKKKAQEIASKDALIDAATLASKSSEKAASELAAKIELIEIASACKLGAYDDDMNDLGLAETDYFKRNQWMHPDATAAAWSERDRLNMHHSHQQLDKWILDIKKEKYVSVLCDDPPHTMFGETFHRATVMMPASVLKWPNMYPHGNKDIPAGPPRYGPAQTYQCKYKALLSEMGFSMLFDSQAVDQSREAQHTPSRTNIQQYFDSWSHGGANHKWMANLINNKDGFASMVKTKLRNSVDAKTRDDGAKMREKFQALVKPAVTIDKNNLRSISIERDLSRAVWPTEAAELVKNNPVASTRYFDDLYHKPQLIVAMKDEKGNDKPLVLKTDANGVTITHHPPRVQVDIPMYRARDYDEVRAIRARNPRTPKLNPCVLIPLCDRFVEHLDLVIPICEIDIFQQSKEDGKTGCGGFNLVGLIWIGKAHALNETSKIPSTVDRSEFFTMCQRYNRKAVPDKDQPIEDRKKPIVSVRSMLNAAAAASASTSSA